MGSKYLLPGPSCSKLTASLVNVLLKFQTLMSEIRQYFLLKKKLREAFAVQKLLYFFNKKNITIFGYKVVLHLMS